MIERVPKLDWKPSDKGQNGFKILDFGVVWEGANYFKNGQAKLMFLKQIECL